MALPTAARDAAPTRALTGTTLSWVLPAGDTPPGAWTLAVVLTGDGGQSVTVAGVADAGEWRVTVSATQTATLGAGPVRWVARATGAAGVFAVATGTLTLTPDGRTAAETDLAALDAAIKAFRESAVAEYVIGTRRVRRIDLPDLVRERQRLAARVLRERRGGAFFGTHEARF